MKNKDIKELVIENILVLIPLLIYGIYKNGYLIYERGLINGVGVLKPLLLIIISIGIKWLVDVLRTKKLFLVFDYNLLIMILIGMIMPYNINLLLYSVTILITYVVCLFLDKFLKYNKVCLIYLIIILFNSLIKGFSYLNILEENLSYSFSGMDLLMGRCIGGMSSSSIIISLIIFSYLTYNFYYKKDIPIAINLTYLLLVLIYFLITKNGDLFINGDLVFASIFISTIPGSSPYKVINQVIYGIFIGIISFGISVIFNPNISIYIATFLGSLVVNLKFDKIRQKILLRKTIK